MRGAGRDVPPALVHGPRADQQPARRIVADGERTLDLDPAPAPKGPFRITTRMGQRCGMRAVAQAGTGLELSGILLDAWDDWTVTYPLLANECRVGTTPKSLIPAP